MGRRSIRAPQTRAAWLFMTPSLIILAIFMVWPIVRNLYLSFTEYDLLSAPKWIGLANYRWMFSDADTMNALKNSLVYAVIVTPVTVALSLAFSIALNKAIRARSFVRTAIFTPFIVSLAIVAIAFRFLLDPNYGLVTSWLERIGLVMTQGILADRTSALVAVMVVGVWKNAGFYMVLFLAGLQSIPGDLYEAAELDGASGWRRFTTVTWPLLSNQTMLVCIQALSASFQVFDQIKVMTDGGPAKGTETLVVLINRLGMNNLEFGAGAAISDLLLVIVLVLSGIQYLHFSKRQVTY
ncbi:carbohydrate ABC transporter permease [Schaalia naturae]|uniref:Carbohydrate ABC transporter permease n=1 Tax=Schaalia naturae TaxID=635203 RepID=A0ABW2SNC7_9ACTO